jgi:hypothetical protein
MNIQPLSASSFCFLQHIDEQVWYPGFSSAAFGLWITDHPALYLAPLFAHGSKMLGWILKTIGRFLRIATSVY